MATINLHLGDCLEAMKQMPDKAYDLAIIDPPYGLGMDGRKGSVSKKPMHNWRAWEYKGWDSNIPNQDYFTELFRVSSNQIVWGANYMTLYLPVSKCWLFWDKGQDLTMPDGELAWTSFSFPIRRKVINRCEAREDGLIHPTQKPVALYKWLLHNYAKEGDKILDTHGGSMSIAIACHDMGFDLDLWELDEEYYAKGVERFNRHKAQLRMF